MQLLGRVGCGCACGARCATVEALNPGAGPCYVGTCLADTWFMGGAKR